MANSSKNKGDAAEREAAALLTELLGTQVRRKLGAGRTNDAGGDTGDLEGVAGFALQVASWKDTSAAAIQKPLGAEEQRINAGCEHAATLVRFRGGTWRVVMTPEQFAAIAQIVISHYAKPAY